MIQEQVIITPILITKAGQVKHFQIKLPKTAKRIIGIELGGRLIPVPKTDGTNPKTTNEVTVTQPQATIPAGNDRPTAFKRNAVAGELKLQSCEEANIFYAGHLQSDNNMGYGDFSQNAFWKVNPFTHQGMSFEEVVIVDAESTMIQGVYKDRLGEQQETNINYLLNVYLWYQR
mgnify:CR=1 FL=1